MKQGQLKGEETRLDAHLRALREEEESEANILEAVVFVDGSSNMSNSESLSLSMLLTMHQSFYGRPMQQRAG